MASTYHRIISPTLYINNDPKIPIPVGILACQRDPLLRLLTTAVVATTVHQPALPATKKPTKNSVISPPIPPDPLLEVILHDTVIFPEGGGQPTDTGKITTLSDGTVWQVVQAKRHGAHAVHYVRVADGNLDVALSAFSQGANVTVALEQEDSDRRYDHVLMSMHTSQHLLSALLESRLNLPTLSWSLTSYPSPCYVEIPRGLSPEEVASIQTEANKLVFEGRKVHVEVEELNKSQESSAEVLPSGRSVGRGLPDDYTGGVKRVVVIDGVDRNPCCGTHLPSLHNLQLFLLPHTDALSRSNTTSARLYFLSGPRLIAYLTSTHQSLTGTAAMLSCGISLVPERTTQVIEERKRAEKRLEFVEVELASAIAKGLVTEAKETLRDASAAFKRYLHRTDDSANVLGFLSAISSAFLATLSSDGQSYLILLTSSPLVQTSSSTTVALLFGSDEKKVKEMGDALRRKLGMKGGGKGAKWSGKFIGTWKETVEGAVVGGLLSEL